MPDTKEVEYVDLTKAKFQRQLAEFGEYSCSLPTGTIVGKKWFRNNDSYLHMKLDDVEHVIGATERKMTHAFPDWWQGEYAECIPPSSERIRIIWRKVRIIPNEKE